jgi:hypothetical protein
MSAERRKMIDGAEGVVDEDAGAHDEADTRSRGKQRICKFFARNGRCRNGDKCSFAHEVWIGRHFARCRSQLIEIIFGSAARRSARCT